MHCPTCNKTLAAGTKCPKCGKLAVASSADEIDLMPMDEPKTTGEAAFQPPPEAFLPPPTMPGKGVKRIGPAVAGEDPPPDEPARPRAGAMVPRGGSTNLILGGVVLFLVLVFIGWRIFRTENRVVGETTADHKIFLVQPNQALVKNVEVSGTISWSFEVTATDDVVSVGVVQRSKHDPQTIVALKKVSDTYDVVKKGETHPMSGVFKTGQYSWVVMNEGKKAVKVKVNFKAQP